MPEGIAPIHAGRDSRDWQGFSTDESDFGAVTRVVTEGVKKGTGNCLLFVKTGARAARNSFARINKAQSKQRLAQAGTDVALESELGSLSL
ncbi:hypothetical protein [Paraburkholderia sp. HD33-4]|uniref:hypothetical protein n=1 Tax=Paraburkholderia sp. HD33-4 TaxID=2883242 RepID=UPI001F1CDB2B|nr:hypothetical protein [Paraburkholderia sp. HD33-4]